MDLRQRFEETERNRARIAQKLEWMRAALIELRDLVREKDRKIFCYRVKTIFLLVLACFFMASTLFFVVYPETAKAVNACLLNTISIFRMDSKDGSPSDLSTPDVSGQEGEAPVRDVITSGSGTITSGPVEKNSPDGLKGPQEQDGNLPE
jgi:hypothetical protein